MKKSDARRLMAERALNIVSAIDKNAFYAGENQYDQYCIDFYYMNNENGRIYLCSCSLKMMSQTALCAYSRKCEQWLRSEL